MTRRRWILIAAAIVLAPFVMSANGQSASNDPLGADSNDEARLAERARDYQRAVDLYTQALEDSSHPATLRRILIRLCLRRGRRL